MHLLSDRGAKSSCIPPSVVQSLRHKNSQKIEKILQSRSWRLCRPGGRTKDSYSHFYCSSHFWLLQFLPNHTHGSFEESLNVEQYVSATWDEGKHRVPVRPYTTKITFWAESDPPPIVFFGNPFLRAEASLKLTWGIQKRASTSPGTSRVSGRYIKGGHGTKVL